MSKVKHPRISVDEENQFDKRPNGGPKEQSDHEKPQKDENLFIDDVQIEGANVLTFLQASAVTPCSELTFGHSRENDLQRMCVGFIRIVEPLDAQINELSAEENVHEKELSDGHAEGQQIA